MLVLLCWEHCLATGNHHPLRRHDDVWQTIQCVVMCSTAQLVSITLNSAANELRFTILGERVNVLGMGPLLALASAGICISHRIIFWSTQPSSSAAFRPSDLRVLVAALNTDPVNAKD